MIARFVRKKLIIDKHYIKLVNILGNSGFAYSKSTTRLFIQPYHNRS